MNSKNIQIRETVTGDFKRILEVVKLGFGYDKEAKLVAELLDDPTGEPIISLLAFYKGEAIGYILFTRAYIEGQSIQPMMHILAPLAVKPDYQRMGVGGLLIREGIRILKEKGSNLIFVLGHKEYYPRFGFIPQAARMGYPPPYPMRDENGDYWMVQSLKENEYDVDKGNIRCCEKLNQPQHWRDDESDR